jgi:TRAP-type C4-dicarboxylate transport system substrate-binding protein
LLSSDQSMEELRHGVADIGLVTPIYARGGAHLIRAQSGFYSGVKTSDAQVALYRCMASSNPQFARELQGLHVLAVQGGTLPGLITRARPVRSLADIRGMRLRAPSELISVLRELGADPVNMPMGEVYSALAKNVIDGVIAPPDTFRALHFAEVARYYTTLAVPRGAYPARVMSEARWRALPPSARAVLSEGVGVWEAALAAQNARAATQGLEEARTGRVTIIQLPPADQVRFDTLYLADAARNAAALSRYGIDGMATFKVARASVGPDGNVHCGVSK